MTLRVSRVFRTFSGSQRMWESERHAWLYILREFSLTWVAWTYLCVVSKRTCREVGSKTSEQGREREDTVHADVRRTEEASLSARRARERERATETGKLGKDGENETSKSVRECETRTAVHSFICVSLLSALCAAEWIVKWNQKWLPTSNNVRWVRERLFFLSSSPSRRRNERRRG